MHDSEVKHVASVPHTIHGVLSVSGIVEVNVLSKWLLQGRSLTCAYFTMQCCLVEWYLCQHLSSLLTDCQDL